MIEKIKFKFFEGQDVEQFTFYRIPKQLFTLEYFKGMSSDAKILYGLMLDRVSLSMKNNWFDDDNRAYIYFSVDDVMELLGCGKNKAIKCLKELDDETGIGLTQKRRQGFGKSNMIYVKTFIVEKPAGAVAEKINNSSKQTSVDGEINHKSDEKQTSVQENSSNLFMEKSDEEMDSYLKINGKQKNFRQISSDRDEKCIESRSIDYQDKDDLSSQKFENQTNEGDKLGTEVYISNFKKFINQTSRSPKNKLQEVYYSNPNNTYKNNNKYNNTKSNLILSPEYCHDQNSGLVDEIRYDSDAVSHSSSQKLDLSQTESGNNDFKVQVYQQLIRRNIDYDNLMSFPDVDHNLVREIYELIVETVLCLGDEIIIASNRYPTEIVKSRFLKLNYMHIRYVLECLEKNTTKVKNIRKYLLAALFNAPATMDGYYKSEVNHGLYGSSGNNSLKKDYSYLPGESL